VLKFKTLISIYSNSTLCSISTHALRQLRIVKIISQPLDEAASKSMLVSYNLQSHCLILESFIPRTLCQKNHNSVRMRSGVSSNKSKNKNHPSDRRYIIDGFNDSRSWTRSLNNTGRCLTRKITAAADMASSSKDKINIFSLVMIARYFTIQELTC
jgi:hypothetical protein